MHSSVRRNDRETSKYNNPQGIHNHWTCQCSAGGSCNLQGGAVDLAQGEGHYRPINTAALSEFPSTPNNVIRQEELIGGMPLLQSVYGVDDNLTVNGHNEVDARSCGCSHLLELSARSRHIMILEYFLRVGIQQQDEGIEVRCCCNIAYHQWGCCY